MSALAAPVNATANSALRLVPPLPAGAEPFKLLKVADLANFPDPVYLVDQLIHTGTLVEVHGPPASGKSFVALGVALSVATGTKWCGREVLRGPTVYVAAEGVSGLKLRTEAWQRANGVGEVEDAYFLTQAVPLLDNREVDRLLASIAAMPTRPVLIVIDTLARCTAGQDENSAITMGGVVAAAARLQAATGGAVLLVHHTTKAGDVERGHSALRGGADLMIAVERGGETVRLSCAKVKDAAPFDPFALRLVNVAPSCVLVPNDAPEVQSTAPRRGGNDVRLLDLVPIAGCISSADLKAAAKGIAITGGTYQRALEELKAAGHIISIGPARDRRFCRSNEGEDETDTTSTRSLGDSDMVSSGNGHLAGDD